MTYRKTIKIFIASSNELKEERDLFPSIFNHLQKLFEGLFCDPVMWETDIPSGSYDKARIQDEINPLLEGSDVIIALFYSKIGKFPFEEYQLARTKKKKVFVQTLEKINELFKKK